MRKRLIIWLLPVLFAGTRVVSTETPMELTNEEKYELNHMEYQGTFSHIPQNPNLKEEIYTYLDSNLTTPSKKLKPNQEFVVTDIVYNDASQQVFKLEDSSYVLADSTIIFEDIVLKEKTISSNYWLPKNFTVYSSPFANQAEKIATNLSPYTEVSVSKIVTTHWGEFAQVATGWIRMDELSETDNRMEAVQELLTQKYASDRFGIYVKQLSTGEVAAVNEDMKMYAASISKLPVLYYAQEQINQGTYSLDSSLQYVQPVTEFKGSYLAEGSGSLTKVADNQGYVVRELMDKTAKDSDNAASNLLAYYMTKQFDAAYYKKMTSITGERWNMESRQASAKMAGLVMEALYEQNGYALQSLIGTQFDNQRIKRDIPVTVAHKIGDADEHRHDVALVYADSPFILSIFTRHADYETISQIANDVYGILK